MTYQWHVFLALLDPVKGSEQAGKRPVKVDGLMATPGWDEMMVRSEAPAAVTAGARLIPGSPPGLPAWR